MRPEREHGLFAAVVAVAAGLELGATLRRIVQASVDLVDAQYGALGVLGSDGNLVDFVYVGVDAQTAGQIGPLPTGEGILGLLIKHPVPIRIDELSTHPASVGFPEGHPWMSSFLGVPVRVRGEVFGNLYLAHKRGNASFTAEDERTVMALAAAAAVAIENARLYDTSRRRQAWLEGVAEISNAVLSGAEVQDVLPTVAHRFRRLMMADTAVVLQPKDLGGMRIAVAQVAGHGSEPQGTQGRWSVRRRLQRSADFDGLAAGWQGKEFPTAQWLEQACSTGQVTAAKPGPISVDRPRSFGHVVVAPMITEEGVLAVLLLLWDVAAEPPGTESIDMASAFAAQVAVTLALARGRQAHERLAILEDRDRIARDLHDLVIQRLFATGMLLQGTSRLAQVDDAVEQRLGRAVDELDETIREIRQTIFALQEPIDSSATSLRGQVLQEANKSASALGFEPSLRFIGAVDSLVTAPASAHLIAALREALANVAKHAQASTVDVGVQARSDEVCLLVVDDGVGVPVGGPSRLSGVANLLSRAHELGGTCTIERVDEHGGTRLCWRVPLSDAREVDLG